MPPLVVGGLSVVGVGRADRGRVGAARGPDLGGDGEPSGAQRVGEPSGQARRERYSHSMVPGGLLVTS